MRPADDWRLTVYALDDRTAGARGEIAQLVRDDCEARGEVEEIRHAADFAARHLKERMYEVKEPTRTVTATGRLWAVADPTPSGASPARARASSRRSPRWYAVFAAACLAAGALAALIVLAAGQDADPVAPVPVASGLEGAAPAAPPIAPAPPTPADPVATADAPPAAAPTPAKRLIVSVEPHAAVVLASAGELERVDAGLYLVSGLADDQRLVIMADAEGFRPASRRVRVGYDPPALSLKLDRVAPEPAPPQPAEPPAPAVADHGFLWVAARPWAQVAIDGRPVGTTPMKLRLTPGAHRVTFNKGSERVERRVQVKEGSTVGVMQDFTR